MKITKTLVILIKKLNKAEVTRFQAYLLYKKRRRLLELFKVFISSRDEEELSYQIRRKKLVKNLRNNQKDLFFLLRKFWTDNVDNENSELEINSMIKFAYAVYEKGLVKEAIKMLTKAEKIAKEKGFYLLQMQANHKLLTLNWMQNPDQTEKLMHDYLDTQQALQHKISIVTKVSYLYQRANYLLIKGVWSLTEEQYQFLKNFGHSIEDILQNEDLEPRWVSLLLSLASSHAIYIQMDGDLAVKYGNRLIDTLHNNPSLRFKQDNLVSSYNILLISLMKNNNKAEFEATYQAAESFFNDLDNPGFSIQTQRVLSKLIYLVYNAIFDVRMETTMTDTILFLETNGKLLSPFYLGQIYSIIFELYYCSGQFEKATQYAEIISNINNTTNLPSLKFSELMAEVLLNYDNQNFEYVINRCSSFKRRYSIYLKFNPVGKLFLKYFIKLSNSDSKATKTKLLREFKAEIIPLLENIRHRTMIAFWNIIPLIDSKINQHKTVEEWMIHNNLIKIND